jgi:hypothetical protein
LPLSRRWLPNIRIFAIDGIMLRPQFNEKFQKWVAKNAAK